MKNTESARFHREGVEAEALDGAINQRLMFGFTL